MAVSTGRAAIICARAALREAPHKDGRASVRDLKGYVERKLGADGEPFTIRILKGAFPPTVTRGLVKRYKGCAEIHFSAELNNCWSRFVVIKELMHLLVDDESAFIGDLIDQVDRVRTFWHETAGKKPDSEDFAMLAAIEYVFPVHTRPEPPIESSLAVATKFLAPQLIVELFYDEDWKDWSSFARRSRELHE